MDKPRFKNKYINELIIEKGGCYTVKPQFETKLPHPSQRVVFAIEVDKETMSELKDISPNLIFETSKDKSLKLVEGTIITTSADLYGSLDKFESFYMNTNEKIGEIMAEFESEKQKNEQRNKVSSPRRKIK